MNHWTKNRWNTQDFQEDEDFCFDMDLPKRRQRSPLGRFFAIFSSILFFAIFLLVVAMLWRSIN